MSKPIDIILTTCPKPFIKSFVDIQTNAIDSWKALNQVTNDVKVHIYLIGNEENIAKAAQIHEINHIPNVKRNERGTPLVSDLFKITKSISLQNKGGGREIVYCFVNSDIILLPDFIHTIRTFIINKKNRSFGPWSDLDYLMVGQRTDVEFVPRLFKLNNLKVTYDDLNEIIERDGQLHSPDGMDYFIFSQNTFPFVYDFAIGKLVWDAWLVGNAFRRGLMTIDATNAITAVHQNGAWYQASSKENPIVESREILEKSEEVLINQSFDYYEKNSKSGTNWKIDFNSTTQTFSIKKKEILSDD